MELGIGSVQFGLNYGVSNTTGRTSEAEVRRVLALAAASGVRMLDTAAAYGDSEVVLGRCLSSCHSYLVITKTVPLDSFTTVENSGRIVREGVFRSLARLDQNSVYAILVHNPGDLLGPNGEAVWAELEKIKAEGRMKKIGVSVYEGEEIDALLSRFPIEIIQVPLNVLDQRLIKGGQLQRLKKKGVEIHARSVFLQGLLLMDPVQAPNYFNPIKEQLIKWRRFVEANGFSPSKAALSFIRSRPEVDVVLIGVNQAAQLLTNIEEFSTSENLSLDYSSFALDDPLYVNPAKWRFAA